ncbi:MAG: bis(5'-nucleosyl)-tetraphosphatase (symmetrical) [Planctomycetota bacterium]|jgi:bis(5'-nucleosyl)-tetraphosphatase (symmetrical)
MSGRRIFIGDIQGCREELERILEAVHFDPAADELHPVGDLVNRGPDSLGVLRLLRSLDAGGVLGNHDLHLLNSARGTRELRARDTIQDVLAADDREELVTWLAGRPLLRAWPDLLCVHAGISPAWKDPQRELEDIDPLSNHPSIGFVTRVRYCDGNGERPDEDWPEPAPPFRPWFEHWAEREHETRTVVFGHWARMGLVRGTRARGLDTGCVWGKRLTAWIAEEDRMLHVPAARVYSPTSLPPEAFP